MVLCFVLRILTSFREIHSQSTTSGEEHYFDQAMEKIYKSCNPSANQLPKGHRATLHRYRCAKFKRLVCANDGPYFQMVEVIHAKCKQALEEQQRNMTNAINEILRKIQKAFESMASKKENDSPEAKKFRSDCNSLLPMCRKIIGEPVKECLDLCRQYK